MQTSSVLARRGSIPALIVTLLLICFLRSAAQDESPASVVKAFYRCLQSADYERAAEAVAGNTDARMYRKLFGDKNVAELIFATPPPIPTRYAACRANLGQIATACEVYAGGSNGHYPTRLSQLVPSQLSVVPTCPASGTTYGFASASDPDAYTIVCVGAHHADEKIPADYPQYASAGMWLAPPGVKSTPAPPPEDHSGPALTLSAFRVVSTRLEGNAAQVEVEETYAVYKKRAQVLARYRLERGPRGWRIDATAPRQELQELVQSHEISEVMRIGQWIRRRGMGTVFAADVSLARTPFFLRERAAGALTYCKGNLKSIGKALAMYAEDHHGHYPQILQHLTHYLRKIPTCPAAETDTYSAGYTAHSAPDAFTVVCRGHHHELAGEAANYPQYTSARGLVEK